VPEEAHWSHIPHLKTNVGSALNKALEELGDANVDTLQDVLKHINFNKKIGQRSLDDDTLANFIQNFEKIPLRDENFELPDLLGAAYEYLIKYLVNGRPDVRPVHAGSAQGRNATRVLREYRNGEGFLYLGRSYRLLLVADQKEPLLLKNGRFSLRHDLVDEGAIEAAMAAFRDYYISRGEERIAQRVNYYAPRDGVTPRDISVRELGNRWASCSPNGNLAFTGSALWPRRLSSTTSWSTNSATSTTWTTPTPSGMRWIRSFPRTGSRRSGCGNMGRGWMFEGGKRLRRMCIR
jgi:hypothetical protein